MAALGDREREVKPDTEKHQRKEEEMEKVEEEGRNTRFGGSVNCK